MNTANLSFNILTFTHPAKELTFYFSNNEEPGLTRLFHQLVPDEVTKHFGEQEHFYTSFDQEQNDYFAITKPTTPKHETTIDYKFSKAVYNSAFSA
jgi:hypothetical protein